MGQPFSAGLSDEQLTHLLSYSHWPCGCLIWVLGLSRLVILAAHGFAQVLDTLLARGDGRYESFARLAMANLHAYSAPTDRSSDSKVQKAQLHCSHALELYRRVLDRDEGTVGAVSPFVCCSISCSFTRVSALQFHVMVRASSHVRSIIAGCIFAANGIGCILAEVGDLVAAKEVFLQARTGFLSGSATPCWACCLPPALLRLVCCCASRQASVHAYCVRCTAATLAHCAFKIAKGP